MYNPFLSRESINQSRQVYHVRDATQSTIGNMVDSKSKTSGVDRRLAQDALVVMKQIKSHIHMMRIAGLQGQLSQLDSKNIEVIRLGVMVNS